MSHSNTPADTTAPRFLHTWNVTLDRMVDETVEEEMNGQTVKVTRKVSKPVATRMGLRMPTRRELRAAELFQASRTAHYVKDCGLLLTAELTNRLINTTGGVLTDKEKSRIEQLRARHVELDMDLARGATTLSQEEKQKIQKELANVRSELINLNAINEAVFSQTAEAKAQNDLSNWFTFMLIMVDRGTEGAPRWVPYFEGQGSTMEETYKVREDFMWKLEETEDEFYNAAVHSIATYVYWLNKGADTPEAFKLMDEELKKQAETRQKGGQVGEDEEKSEGGVNAEGAGQPPA